MGWHRSHWHGRRTPHYRVEYRPIWTMDARTGRPRISLYIPHRTPTRTSHWADLVLEHKADTVLFVGFAVAFVAAVVAQ